MGSTPTGLPQGSTGPAGFASAPPCPSAHANGSPNWLPAQQRARNDRIGRAATWPRRAVRTSRAGCCELATPPRCPVSSRTEEFSDRPGVACGGHGHLSCHHLLRGVLYPGSVGAVTTGPLFSRTGCVRAGPSLCDLRRFLRTGESARARLMDASPPTVPLGPSAAWFVHGVLSTQREASSGCSLPVRATATGRDEYRLRALWRRANRGWILLVLAVLPDSVGYGPNSHGRGLRAGPRPAATPPVAPH